jgi:hypothetical protein
VNHHGIRQVTASRTALVAVLTALAMLGAVLAPGTATASDRASNTSARAVQKSTVLKNEFGKARSGIVGTFGAAGTLVGDFKPRRVKAVGDQLFVIGKLRADLVRGNGNVIDSVNQRVRLPVESIEGASLPTARANCDILNLVLGPLDLDLLGLQVHLDRVVLNIVAASGAGNLLGNLLCAVAGLLDGTGVLGEISQILNSILAILRL